MPLLKDYRAAIENCFLWQILYRIPATNHWRFPLDGQSQPDTWCTHCMGRALEDVMHCFWRCLESCKVWIWIQILVQKASNSQCSFVSLFAPEVLLGKKFPRHYKIPRRWWNIIWAETIWQIWKSRCSSHCLDSKPSSTHLIRIKVWHHLKLYIREAWQEIRSELWAGQISLVSAQRWMIAWSTSFGRKSSASQSYRHVFPEGALVLRPSGPLVLSSTLTHARCWYWFNRASSPTGLVVTS